MTPQGGTRAALVLVVMLQGSLSWGGEVKGWVHFATPVTTADGGSTAPDVVVYLTGFHGPPPSVTPVVAQRQKQFVPTFIVLVAGQSVRFTNEDDVVHNVFSASRARPFDLGKPGPGQTRDVKFSTPGLVDVYCNIHEAMGSQILVLPNRAFARVDASGGFLIHDVPDGRHPLFAWGPGVNPVQTEVTVLSGKVTAPLEITLTPRLYHPVHLDKFGKPYRARAGYAP